MKTIDVISEGIKGGSNRMSKNGYVGIYHGNDKLLSIDNYMGHGETYKQREEPIITIFDGNASNVIFEGTHSQLIAKLKG